jgi:quercetin dioxygenase-like cupin family protein
MSAFTDYREHIGVNPERFFKTTLFLSERMLLGLDCLEPGQMQHEHRHAGRDKFYYVIEGEGTFTIGEEHQVVGPGGIVWAGADVLHSVVNTGTQRLVMLIGIAPEPK